MNTSDAREQRANEEIDEQLEYERQKGNDHCIECDCDLTHMDDGDDTCCWCLERKTGDTMPW